MTKEKKRVLIKRYFTRVLVLVGKENIRSIPVNPPIRWFELQVRVAADITRLLNINAQSREGEKVNLEACYRLDFKDSR